MKTLVLPARSSILAFAFTLFALLGSLGAAEVEIFKESFETDGVDTRYTVENPSDDGSNDFFARRLEGSAGTRPRGGALDGDWFWGARDLDGDGVEVNDLEDHEARITWSDAIDISGLGNITIKVAVAQGDDG